MAGVLLDQQRQFWFLEVLMKDGSIDQSKKML